MVAQLDRVTDYESVGRGFESLPSHQEKPEHIRVLVFLFVCTMEGLEQGGGAQRRKQSHSAALLSLRVPMRRNVYRGSCGSKDFMAFLFFWQGLHTFAHLLHTLQKSHELFASLAQRVFRCTKKNLLREEHPRQLAAFLCVHLPDGFKDHFACDFCCHRPRPASRSRLRSSQPAPIGACPACGRRCPSGRWRLHGRCCPAPT